MDFLFFFLNNSLCTFYVIKSNLIRVKKGKPHPFQKCLIPLKMVKQPYNRLTEEGKYPVPEDVYIYKIV